MSPELALQLSMNSNKFILEFYLFRATHLREELEAVEKRVSTCIKKERSLYKQLQQLKIEKARRNEMKRRNKVASREEHDE